MKTITRCTQIQILLILLTITFKPSNASPKGLFRRCLSVAITPSSALNCTPKKAVSLINKKIIDNFHIVEDNMLYRSAQLSPNRLEQYIRQHGIKTVLNLRGEHPELAWWRAQAEICQRNNAQLHNIPMSANELTSKDKLLKLLDIYDNAPKPILIHCRRGVDRTGEAAAIWMLDKMGTSNKKALFQLSPFYQHFKFKHPAKTFLIKEWRNRNWLINDYNPAKYPQFAQKNSPE